jgi:hypothetical protein
MYFPNGTEAIPDWFEHRSRGQSISFWFRKKIPSITSILILPTGSYAPLKVNYAVNDYEYTISHDNPSTTIAYSGH